MKTDFSEFSFGFGFINDLLGKLGPSIVAAPEFPSLIQEGTLGYDAKIDFPGLPLFFQFKLCEYMKHPLAREWPDYVRPYFRFAITPANRSPQHNLLRDLARRELVFYIAPLFSTVWEFNRFFLAKQVSSRSIWIPLSRLPSTLNSDRHWVTYTSPNDPRWHTTEREILNGDFSGERFVTEITGRFARGEVQRISRAYISELRRGLVDILRQRDLQDWPDLPDDFGSDREGVRDIRYLLMTFFDCHAVVLRSG